MSHDLTEKLGQIAHLDQDPSNDAENNLAFLCVAHHSLYDSKTSQHKNFTMDEVKDMRNSLEAAIQNREHAHPPLPASAVVGESTEFDQRFHLERRNLPDSDLINAIRNMPHWQTLIQPIEFLPGQFRSLNDCEAFIRGRRVICLRHCDYPICVDGTAIARDPSNAGIRGETDYQDSTELHEGWALSQSAQFVLTRALPAYNQAPKSVDFREILRVCSHVFEFARRLMEECDISSRILCQVSLTKVDGFDLSVPNRFPSTYCKTDKLDGTVICSAAEIKSRSREQAIDVAKKIYSGFGWRDPAGDYLVKEQRRFLV